MSDSTIDIDRIVREVVRRLQGLNGQASNEGPKENHGPPPRRRTLHVADQVVTMAQVADRLSDVQQLLVPQRAIVTPAVHDELRARKISLIRDDSPSGQIVSDQGGKRRLVVARDEQTCSLQHLPKLAALEMKQVDASDLATQLQQIEDCLGRNGGIRSIGLFVTQRPHVIACEANRRPSFRAAFVGDVQQATEARESLDANLFVVRPVAPFRLHGMIQAAIG